MALQMPCYLRPYMTIETRRIARNVSMTATIRDEKFIENASRSPPGLCSARGPNRELGTRKTWRTQILRGFFGVSWGSLGVPCWGALDRLGPEFYSS